MIYTPKELQTELKKINLVPSKRLGQNFLIDKNILVKIVEAAELNKQDVVLEIGPGLGILTKELASRAGKVIAIEKDKKLTQHLREAVKQWNQPTADHPQGDNITIIDADFLRTDISKLDLGKNYKVVANLPYSITSAAIRKIMEVSPRPSAAVLMVQKEVAERICAKPGSMSLLALSVQYYGTPKLLFKVFKGAFWPMPKVDSAVIKIVLKKNQESRIKNQADNFFKIARIGFASPRKQLQNNLTNGLHIKKEEAKSLLAKTGLDPKIRPEELGVEDWERLEAQRGKL